MKRATAIVLVSAILYACVSIAVRVLLLNGVPVDVTVMGRFAISTLALLVLPWALGRRSNTENRTRILLFLLGAIFIGLQAMILFSALQSSATAPVIILFFTFPVWAAIISAVTGVERSTLVESGLLALVCIGAFLVSMPMGVATISSGGAFRALLAALMYGIFLVAASVLLKDIGQLEGAGWVAAGATAVSAASTIANGERWPLVPMAQLPLFLLVGVLGTLALLGYFYGLDAVGANTVSLFGVLEPVVAALLAAVLLAETLTPIQAIGGTVVVLGLTVRSIVQRSLEPIPPTVSVQE